MLENYPKRLERYKRLIEISRDLASTLELDPLLNRIIHAARDITDAEAASILLYDDTARELYFQVATNPDPMMRGMVIPMDSIAGWIVTHREPVRISDVKKTHVTSKTSPKPSVLPLNRSWACRSLPKKSRRRARSAKQNRWRF